MGERLLVLLVRDSHRAEPNGSVEKVGKRRWTEDLKGHYDLGNGVHVEHSVASRSRPKPSRAL